LLMLPVSFPFPYGYHQQVLSSSPGGILLIHIFIQDGLALRLSLEEYLILIPLIKNMFKFIST
jgi:hypothetical protein